MDSAPGAPTTASPPAPISAQAPAQANPQAGARARAQATEQQLKSLFLSALDGDTRAYQSFLQALGGVLRAFLRKRLRDKPQDVEDLVQEILIAVHNGRHTYLPEQPLTAWMYAIARYKTADFLRSRYRHEAWTEPLDEDAEDLFAASDDEAAHARRDVDQLLSQLPDRHRLPILHVKLQGLSVAETAQLTGLSESAIKVGIHRGLKALAQMIRGVT
jgi:RNA polymerase sigma-70 factor (ECF subfamily)